jgi:hypothetical protein
LFAEAARALGSSSKLYTPLTAEIGNRPSRARPIMPLRVVLLRR